MADNVTVTAGNKLYNVRVPKALRRGVVVDWPEGKDAKFAIVGLTPDEIHALFCQMVAQTNGLAVQYRADLTQAAYESGRRVGIREGDALPVMDDTAD